MPGTDVLMMILGIDPGSRFCGYGLLETEGRKVIAAGCDVIDVSRGKDLAQRLHTLYKALGEVLDEYAPDCAAVESMFFQKHIRSIFTLGHARGVILLALAQREIPIVEYSPKEIKKAVVGGGNATKAQVRYMIEQLYDIRQDSKKDDAYDALAIATAHFHRVRWETKL